MACCMILSVSGLQSKASLTKSRFRLRHSAVVPPQRRHEANQQRCVVHARAATLPDVALQRLGLAQGASPQDVKRAYRKLALKFHPDVCKSDSCATSFMQITNAYEVVMNNLPGNSQACIPTEPFVSEPMMGVYDEDWEDWEEWMGWEGAGTLDYSNHVNHDL